MAEVQESWKEVAGRAEALGLKLKLHLEQEQDEQSERRPGDTKAMIEDLGKRVGDAFDSMGNAAKDPAVHEDVKEMGRLFRDALMNTFNKVGAEVARAGHGAHGSGTGDSADEPAASTSSVEDPGAGDESDGSDA